MEAYVIVYVSIVFETRYRCVDEMLKNWKAMSEWRAPQFLVKESACRELVVHE